MIIRDITERKKAIEALRESEEKYRNIVDRATDGITIIQDGVVRFLNSRLAEMWGGACDEIIGAPFTSFVHPDELARVMDYYRRRISGEAVPPIYETVLLHKDGSKVYTELNAGIISYEGRPADLVIIRDITDRKQAEETLRVNEAKFAGIFNNMGEGMIYLSWDGIVRDVNPPLCRIAGLSRDAIIGQNIMKLIHRLLNITFSPEIIQTIMQALHGKKIRPFTIKYQGRHLEVSSPYRVDENHIVGIIRDITAKKESEYALKKSRDQLKKLADHIQLVREEEKLKISREIHDDLGQQLTALKMDIDWLITHTGVAADHSGKLKEISGLLSETMESVHRIVRELRPPVLDDLGFLEAINWLVANLSERSHMKVTLQMEAKRFRLPRNTELILFRVIQEALTNVIRHSGATEAAIRILKEKQMLRITIQDNGVGISGAKIISPDSFGIMGMKERIEACRGRLAITGKRKEGTKVKIELPL